MKNFSLLFIIMSLVLAVSCGGDKGGKSKNNLYSNQLSTVNANYTPAKPQQIYYGGKWYQIQPYGNAQMELQTVYSTAVQVLNSGASTYRISVVNNIPVFTVRVVGTLGGMTQYPNQYPSQPVANTGVFTIQSIQLLK